MWLCHIVVVTFLRRFNFIKYRSDLIQINPNRCLINHFNLMKSLLTYMSGTLGWNYMYLAFNANELLHFRNSVQLVANRMINVQLTIHLSFKVIYMYTLHIVRCQRGGVSSKTTLTGTDTSQTFTCKCTYCE